MGSSDSHNAGRTTSPTQAPIGTATTVVYAPELSERGVRSAVKARHTYVKVTGNAGPDLRFTARPYDDSGRAIMGDIIRARGARFRARVIGGAGRDLLVIKNGRTVTTVPVTSERFTHRFQGSGSGRWRLQLAQGALIDTVSSPIWIEPGDARVKRSPCRRARSARRYC